MTKTHEYELRERYEERVLGEMCYLPSYSDAYIDGCKDSEKRFKEYLENAIKSYKSRGEVFFATEIKTMESILTLFKEE